MLIMLAFRKTMAGSVRSSWILPLGLLVLLLGLGACKSEYPSGARQNRAGEKTARQVKTARVEETPFGEAVTVNGTLAAYVQTTASVKVPGRLRSITVDLGSVVRRGQVIAQVEPQDYETTM